MVRGALRLLVAGAVVAAGLGLAASPAAAASALTVTPATGLLDQQIVTVTGSGFTPGEWLIVAQCHNTGCILDAPINTTATYAWAAADGTFSVTLSLRRTLGAVSCADVECAIAALEAPSGDTELTRTAVDFEPTGTTVVPDATLAIATPDMRANGAAIATWVGSGYRSGFLAFPHQGQVPLSPTTYGLGSAGAYVNICTAAPTGGAGCERLLGWGTAPPPQDIVPRQQYVTVWDGEVFHERSLPRMWEGSDGRIDCAAEDCSFALEQDGAPHSNVADVAWAPEWSPWPSARAFVVEAYAVLIGRAPTTAERSTATAALTDRSLTGFTFLRRLAGRPDGLRLAELSRLYQAALGRRPDAGGLLYWASELRRTGSMAAIAGAFGRTQEFWWAYDSGNDFEAVHSAYVRTLARAPSAAEYGYWVGRLGAGMSRTHLVHLFSRTPEFLAREAGRSELAAVLVALLNRGPDWSEWSGPGPDSDLDSTTRSQRVDDAILDVLSDDGLIAEVG